jgi:hypothetical protein
LLCQVGVFLRLRDRKLALRFLGYIVVQVLFAASPHNSMIQFGIQELRITYQLPLFHSPQG